MTTKRFLAWLRAVGPAQAGTWCAISVLLALAAHGLNLRTKVEIFSDGSMLRCTVAGTELEAPVEVPAFEGVALRASTSLIPPGGRFIEVEDRSGLQFRDDLPARFALPRRGRAPLGDWCIDRLVSEAIVYEGSVSASAPWTLRAELLGRPLNFVTFVLEDAAGAALASVRVRRGMLNNDAMIADPTGTTLAIAELAAQPLQRVKGAAATLSASLATASFLVAVVFAVVWIGGRGRSTPPAPERAPTGYPSPHEHPHDLCDRRTTVPAHVVWVVVIILALVATLLSAWVAGHILEGVPHIPDSVAYIMQAKWFLAGSLTQDVRPFQEQLNLPFTFVVDDRWMSQYPFGWPFVLAIGEVLGRTWLVSPLLGGVYIILVFLVGCELYSKEVGLVAALLGLVSPMSTLIFASHMSHAGTSVLLLLFVWLFLVGRRQRRPWILLASGACLGYAFGIRPLTAVAVAIPFAILGFDDLLRRVRAELPAAIAFFTGGVLGATPTMLSNAAVTGSPFTFPYSLIHSGFFGIEFMPDGLRNLDALLVHTAPALFGWGWPFLPGWIVIGLGFSIACMPFLLGRRQHSDALLLLLFIEVALAYLLTRWNGLHGYGPRYYFEIFFVIYLLTARGFQELARIGTNELKSVWSARAATALFVVFNATAIAVLPGRLVMYRGYNHVDGGLERAIAEQGVEHGLVLFGSWQWYDWGRAARLHQSDPDADLVFACRRGNLDALLSYYEGSQIYVWANSQLTQVDRE